MNKLDTLFAACSLSLCIASSVIPAHALGAPLPLNPSLLKGSPVTALRLRAGVNVPVADVRRGPGSQYAVLTQLRAGDEVQVLAQEFGWYKIRIDDVIGYIKVSLVDTRGVSRAFIEPIQAQIPCASNKAPNASQCLRLTLAGVTR